MAGRQGWNLRKDAEHCTRYIGRGEAHSQWKGNAATDENKRKRARAWYPLKRACERCGGVARDRHHRDGNPGNNTRANIAFLCRRCHMTIDGRLARQMQWAKRTRSLLPPQPCIVCGVPSKPLRRGRCHACNEYWRRHGLERKTGQGG